jgi:hypothetical protein
MGLDMGTFMGRLSSSERAGKEAITFLKKVTKKLLLDWTAVFSQPLAQGNKSFLVLFFKKERLPF